MPFTESDIENAEFIITDSGIIEELNSNQGYDSASTSDGAIPMDGKGEYYFNQLQGDVVPVIKLPGE